MGGAVPIWHFFYFVCTCATSPAHRGPGSFFVEGASGGVLWVSVAVGCGMGWVEGFGGGVLVSVEVDCGLEVFVSVVPP